MTLFFIILIFHYKMFSYHPLKKENGKLLFPQTDKILLFFKKSLRYVYYILLLQACLYSM